MDNRRQNLILAAMGAGRSEPELSPVQVQKLFFLIDREAAGVCGGPYFDFQPYDYGPFDSDLYDELACLAQAGQVDIDHSGPYRIYKLTDSGRTTAARLLKDFDPKAQKYFGKAKDWVKSLGFSALVANIYRAYPEMRANSIFS